MFISRAHVSCLMSHEFFKRCKYMQLELSSHPRSLIMIAYINSIIYSLAKISTDSSVQLLETRRFHHRQPKLESEHRRTPALLRNIRNISLLKIATFTYQLEDIKKAALTELKGEKGRICCLIWMLIVIGSETKKSLSWFCNLDEGRSRSFNETSQITILVDPTSVKFDYWVKNVELG